jgi:hypothetical protein
MAENAEMFKFETACVCCGGITRYKVPLKSEVARDIKKSIESGEDPKFIDFCGYCCKNLTMTVKHYYVDKALYDEITPDRPSQ